MDFTILILVIVSILLGALVRSIFGFGEALVTMPLLSLFSIDFKLSVSIVAIVGLLVAFPVFIKSRRNLNWSIVRRLLVGSIIGAPVGILIVKWANEDVIIKVLGIFILLYGTINLINHYRNIYQINKQIPKLYDYIAGLVSGILGSAYNSHGVPIIVYGTFKKWHVTDLKNISQVHFFITGCFIVFSHGVSGFWSSSLWYLLIMILPLLIITLWVGHIINTKINQQVLIKYIYILLICFGIVMIIK
ncbi:sulfite exporter TauE/SafE family protein [Mammaliicoccus fleurettii]|uniref:sulfite exporter TauE/SafE family protein n=1 Tax=Mammaliicoccus fleurettii TaxID=150056 RepID=UPI002DB8EEBD|nr:sulfite exporter TauE/SafE family protein [Mammaliicoccus fleurettii]MEB7723328.1 sulfite exporter TauE/SafE family protein [Mammaliicoccus fleurettii]